MIDTAPGRIWRNWGRTVRAEPSLIVRAATVEDVQAAVRLGRERGLAVKPIGAGHSFSPVAATNGIQLDVSGLDGLLGVEPLPTGGALVTLGAGTPLHRLPALLRPHGLAMANLGDIDRQTIAGATATGTHGTGLGFGGLATQVRGAKLVTATGELLVVSATEHSSMLPAVALGVGALGVLIEVTIECVPAFGLAARETRERLERVLDEWGDRIARADHFEFYTWPHAELTLTKTNTRLPPGAPLEPLGRVRGWVEDELLANGALGSILRVGALVPPAVPPLNRLVTRLASDRAFSDGSHAVFVSPRTFRFRELEYAVPVEAVPAAVREVRRLIDARRWRISMPIEVRAAAADDLWLSTAHGRDTGYIAVHRFAGERPGDYFREVEAVLRAHDGRPHWGKLHGRTAADLRPAYPRFDDFLALRDRLDPERVFANGYLRRVLGD